MLKKELIPSPIETITTLFENVMKNIIFFFDDIFKIIIFLSTNLPNFKDI